MITGFSKTSKKLTVGILLTLILLTVCIAMDSATDTITNINNSDNQLEQLSKNENYTIVNQTYYILDNNSGKAMGDGKIYTEKPKYPTYTITARPSCSNCVKNHRSYTWRTSTFINYCPYCNKYGTLYNAHKWQSKHEQEITCKICGGDFCGVCGKEKYSWSHKYLTKV